MTANHLNIIMNLQSFIDRIVGSYIEKIVFILDDAPTFNKKSIPFDFKYCHYIIIITKEENFKVFTSSTENGLDTFWIEIEPTKEITNIACNKKIISIVQNITFSYGYDNLPYKIRLEFENYILILYSADIYDTWDNSFECKINDEMILAFENVTDADRFEKEIKYSG